MAAEAETPVEEPAIIEEEADEEPGRTDGSAHVTGSVMSMTMSDEGEFTDEGAHSEDWVGHLRGVWFLEEFEWSDPPLPSQAEVVINGEAYDPAGIASDVMWLLEDADGYWTGPWTGWCSFEDHCHGVATITGHGAYEGLCAVITERQSRDASAMVDKVLEGGIFRGDMPPVPEPLEPSAE